MSISRTITGFIILAIVGIPGYFVYTRYIMPDTTAVIECPEGNFTITFPCEPKKKTSSSDIFIGQMKSVNYTAFHWGIEMSITYEEFPDEESVYRELPIPNASGGSATSKLEQRILDFHGHKLYQSIYTAFSFGTEYTRELVIGKYRYIMKVKAKTATDYTKGLIFEFFDSFELLDLQQLQET
ncbi:MAG: hypothetical protein ACYTE8_02825 [Planctomycetota bacterium]|jgi:hypothetical protein